MPRFRKKPVIIEATQINERVEIATREGTLYGEPGDWLITGVAGEQYPCGSEIFRATYEPATDEAELEWQRVYGPDPEPTFFSPESDAVYDWLISLQGRRAKEVDVMVIAEKLGLPERAEIEINTNSVAIFFPPQGNASEDGWDEPDQEVRQ